MLTEKQKDLLKLVSGFLSALLAFLTILGFGFGWFTPATIDAFMLLLGAGIALGTSLYATWTNNYTQKKAFERADEKRQKQEEENKKVGL